MEYGKDRARIIQESVPGKQITIAHIIANPDKSLYDKLSFGAEGALGGAIGIVTITPGETAIIAGDIAIKTTGAQIAFLDRINGTLIVTGTVSEVETSLHALIDYAEQKLGFSVCAVTKT